MIAPAIHFNGNCAEAIELYKRAFEITDIHIDYVDDAPEGSGLDKRTDMRGMIMHSNLTISGSLVNMCDAEAPVTMGDNIILNVFIDADAVKRAFDALKEGGRVVVPMGPQFFSPMYASVEDRFGVRWQLIS